MADKQTQKAGSNSNQIQANTVNVGIDEKRAREIVDEKLSLALKDFTNEALKTAQGRSSKFDSSLIPRMVKEQALEAFSDPSFQILLVEAQKTAASTEREPDYDLLSELLIHRFKNGSDRNVRAGVSRAVEIVDQVSDDALLALTTFHSASRFSPNSIDLQGGLEILEELFAKFDTTKLPVNIEWIDHLDILDAIRSSSFGGIKKLEVYWLNLHKHLCLKGIKTDSKEFSEAKKLLTSAGLSDNILVSNNLDERYVRIPVSKKSMINTITLFDGKNHRQPTTAEVDVLENVFALYDEQTISSQELSEQIDQFENLRRLKEWWNNNSNHSIQITSVGKVLAHSNAQRIDSSIPPLG